MKRQIVSAILISAAVMAGCSQKQEPAGLTQEIVESSVTAGMENAQASQGSTAEIQSAASANAQSSQSGTAETYAGTSGSSGENTSAASIRASGYEEAASIYTGDIEKDTESYYRVKAEKDALDIDIDNLEAKFRVGELDKDTFRAQKMELEDKEDILDMQEDILENAIDLEFYKNAGELPMGDAETLMKQKRELKIKENELELNEDQTEFDYSSGKITRDEFIELRIEGIREEEELDRQEDLLEMALKRMGYDD